MPQMSPMWWDIMYINFIIIFLLTNMINYWMKNKISKKYNKIKNKNMTWLW
uniref:ATP synthase F0 subunit 8 n=1 Tax=Malcus inconspicuus TaxID=498929 RepID=B7SMF6_9HEMI|nr:ATP synthase F0 subunit 8 [Malcus inconspicuus]ABZ02050.1 ATP synthase F0 subunit 8 [Malcus inconspicuus]